MAIAANSINLSRRQAALAGIGIFGAAILPSACVPEAKAARQWPVAVGFDIAAERAKVRAASERCMKASEACERCVVAQYAIPADDEAAWHVENERLLVEARVVEDEFMAASRHFADVRAGFNHRLLASLGIGDVFDF